MSPDILDKIDDTLTYYSAGLDAEVTVPVEKPANDWPNFVPALWIGPLTAGFRSLIRAAMEAEQELERARALRGAAFAGHEHHLHASFFRRSASPKVLRRHRRAQLRRVHRDYVQRNRRRPVDLLFCAFDETHRFHPDTQEAR